MMIFKKHYQKGVRDMERQVGAEVKDLIHYIEKCYGEDLEMSVGYVLQELNSLDRMVTEIAELLREEA